MTHIRVEQRIGVTGDLTHGRAQFEGKDKNFDLCRLGCKVLDAAPERCQIRKKLDLIEAIHHVRVITWECEQFRAE